MSIWYSLYSLMQKTISYWRSYHISLLVDLPCRKIPSILIDLTQFLTTLRYNIHTSSTQAGHSLASSPSSCSDSSVFGPVRSNCKLWSYLYEISPLLNTICCMLLSRMLAEGSRCLTPQSNRYRGRSSGRRGGQIFPGLAQKYLKICQAVTYTQITKFR